MATATAVFGASFSRPEASAASADASAPFAASRAASARALFALGDDYGDEAARELAEILRSLQEAGFAKASASDYSGFDRILGGVCWLLQRLVKREDAEWGRVQWELLFQPHDKMKPRLGLAQDVVSRIHRLPLAGAQQHLQPHQLLLQDFGDIGAVRRLVEWLVACQRESAVHLETICTAREYMEVVVPAFPLQAREPLKREVVYLQRAYQPRRRYQYASTQDDGVESEDALIQKCLLEYGERVAVNTVVEPDGQENDALTVDGGEDPHKSLMAQLAAASVASMARRTEGSTGSKNVKAKSKDVREFEAQYQRILQQAMVEQTALLEKQRARETELLRQVVSVPATPLDDDDGAGSETSTEIKAEQTRLHDRQVQLATLEDVKQRLQKQRDLLQTEELVMIQAMEGLQAEKEQLEMDERASEDAQPLLSTLRNLVAKNEALKKQKSAFKAMCKTDLEALQVRVAQLQQQTKQEAAQQDEETLRLHEIEQMHAQMASKHKDLRVALARQTRELQKRMKQIDEVPTRIELIQYEKRFLELYDEVALTLDETRKYYSVYNTLKTTHEFLEKEISLINSMHDNFDVAMASKPATQAFFSQLDGIIQNVETSVRKQQTLRADHQLRVETLDSKYQLLLEKERAYVNAIREFQKECEKNEKLHAKLAQYQRHMQQANVSSEDLSSGVSLDDVVI